MDKWNAKQYEKFKKQRSQPFFELLQMVVHKEKMRVIDLGCGTGELTQILHQRLNARYTLGIDTSENMLSLSQQHLSNGLEFKRQNIISVDPSLKFDLVFSNAALQWIENHDVLLQNLFQLVTSGGQIAIQMPINFDHPSHQIAASVATKLYPDKFDKHTARTNVLAVEKYAELLFQNGFINQNCKIRVYGHPMTSGRDVVEWTKGTLLTGYQAKLSPEEFSDFLDAYTRTLMETIGDQPYFYGFKRMLLWGIRK